MNVLGILPLTTPRLNLRRFTLADAPDMYREWASDPEVTRYLTWPAHGSELVTRGLLEIWVREYEEGAYQWAIEEKATGRVIGSIAVVRMDAAIESAELGYALGQAHWGQSLMPEALRAVLDFLFDEVGANRVCACHDVRNHKSGRVMEKAGMLREGVLRQAARNNQGICDIVMYSMVRSDRA